jgi:hypothetical protein
MIAASQHQCGPVREVPANDQEVFPMNLAYDTAAIRSPAKPAVPSLLSRALSSAWVALKSVGRARARREVLRLSREVQASRPELAAQLRRVAKQSWL